MNRDDLYYHVTTEKLKDQALRQRAVDAKLSGLIGVAVALAGVAALILRDASTTFIESCHILYLSGGIAGLFLGSVITSLKALLPYRGLRNPNLDTLQSHVQDVSKNDSELTQWVGDELKKTIRSGEEVVTSKQRHARLAAGMLGAMAFLTLAFAILTSVLGAV